MVHACFGQSPVICWFFGQLWKYGEDIRCALDTFLCRPPSVFILSHLGEIQNTASGVSCFYCWQNGSFIHFDHWKRVHVINQELEKSGYRRGAFMVEGGKKSTSILPLILACQVWWCLMSCCTSYSYETPASHSSKTAKLPLVLMWQEGLVSFVTDGATAKKLFLQLCHHIDKQVQYSAFLYPVISYTLFDKCMVEVLSSNTFSLNTGDRCCITHVVQNCSLLADCFLHCWEFFAVNLSDQTQIQKGALPTPLKRNLLLPSPDLLHLKDFQPRCCQSVLTGGRELRSLTSFVFVHIISIYATKTLGLE